jgi:type IV pilus assembly protein PilM
MKGERRVFLATYPRNAVDTLVGTLRKAGIRPYVMDIAPLSLSRIPDVPRSIIVNTRLDHLEVMVIAERMPQVIRRLSLPGESESLEENLPLFAEEFSRTVTFYNSSHMETPLDPTVPVFVCGDLAGAPDTWQTLLGERDHPVSALPLAVEAPEGFDADPFLVNVGLALKELQPDKETADFSIINFNALPEAYQPKHFSIARVLVPVGLAIGIGAIAFAGIMMIANRAQIADLRPQVTAAETRVADLQRDVATLRGRISAMGPTADALNNRISAMEMGRAAISMDLAEINRLAGTTVQLATVNHGGGSVTLQGSTSAADAVYDFADALRKSDRFSGVWIRSVTVTGAQHTFAIDVSK